MKQILKLQIPRRLGILMQDPQLDKITLSIDHYNIELTIVDDDNSIPKNQAFSIDVKD